MENDHARFYIFIPQKNLEERWTVTFFVLPFQQTKEALNKLEAK